VSLLFSFLLCALCSLPVLLLKKKNLKDALPLGPFIYFGFGFAAMLSLI
jgi:possible prepilin peptidase